MIATKKFVEEKLVDLHLETTEKIDAIKIGKSAEIDAIRDSIEMLRDSVFGSENGPSKRINRVDERNNHAMRGIEVWLMNIANRVNALADYLGVEFTEAGVKAVKKAKR